MSFAPEPIKTNSDEAALAEKTNPVAKALNSNERKIFIINYFAVTTT